ncbi:pyrroline-5-carboxylate reductase [Candidatus Thioglobus sp.]|jgi:pyrroline-5-carboxylate reductase|uniref:pyrroline-5-carboxylate reductase n=1 Tax=Candidatus Pseudothioglobus sp. Uisw_016 TaxID=3230995 RepID=UPI002333117C|nr:pyrroline-5-carboxylate reductase [Candidatus Thioglobus sp.]MDB9975329.1 pyrroline-5-carboxylate reductase [Candidatus Thioglobus sp.]MDC1447000.1 pyrroline-5-carboxylate reductase [Candidatus Thioglobus sp.]MDC3360236.1 pyrroline-5-carboxylate reductase [Candidatus Thioglobus sp.]
MENKTVIGFIGAGNMAYALIKGLLSNGFDAKNINVSDSNDELLINRQSELKITTYSDNNSLLDNSDIVVFAVKPQVLSIVCLQLKNKVKPNHLFVSIVAGIRGNDINRWLGGNFALVRTMPNTPALFQSGVTGLFANDLVSNQQKELVTSILSSVGQCFWVDDEKLIDAITAISGSGPAYFFLLMQSITQAATALGLDEKTANSLSIQTSLGASLMATKSGKDSKTLRKEVTSPNGTTQAAIESFQDQNFEGIVAAATRAAYDRARELSNDLGDVE